ncbi:MAG: hypothetical protein JW892_15130 [Anaerolineae bacterium]|nr:hypothetical protein [Anaerolineae bacterium]
MGVDSSLDAEVTQWVALLEQHGLADAVLPWLDILRVWGFVGAQLLWMLSFFSSSTMLPALASALEQPDLLQVLQHRLMEGGAPG